MRRFLVATNWEKELIDGLSQYPEVKSVFGKLRNDVVGGGRASFSIPEVSRRQAIEYIRYVHSKGLEFNYLFNACCLGNIEFTKEGREKIIKELDWAIFKARVDLITVSNNYLLGLVRKRYPEVKVGLGLYTKVFDLDQFKYYQDLGVEYIVISHSFVKDFKLVKKLSKVIKCKIFMIVNEIERYICPNAIYHSNSFSHMSRVKKGGNWIDPWNCQCTKYKLVQKPEEFIRAGYIRPEDLKTYEDMGYYNFKIVDRGKSTPWLLRAVRAYVDREYRGNLLDIVNQGLFIGREDASCSVRGNFFEYFKKNIDSEKKWLKFYFGKYKNGFPYINNQKLEGVLEHFKDKGPLGEDGYLNSIVKEAISFSDVSLRDELVEVLDDAIGSVLFPQKNK